MQYTTYMAPVRIHGSFCEDECCPRDISTVFNNNKVWRAVCVLVCVRIYHSGTTAHQDANELSQPSTVIMTFSGTSSYDESLHAPDPASRHVCSREPPRRGSWLGPFPRLNHNGHSAVHA